MIPEEYWGVTLNPAPCVRGRNRSVFPPQSLVIDCSTPGLTMHPALRVVLAILGALVGTSLGSGSTQLFAAIMGALAGLAVSEALYLRDSLTRLRAELSDVRNSLGRRRTEPSERIESA